VSKTFRLVFSRRNRQSLTGKISNIFLWEEEKVAKEKSGKQSGVALLNQALGFIGISKRFKTEQEAKTAGRDLRQLWAKQPDRRLTSADRMKGHITTELRMLAEKGGPEHTLACTFIRELGQNVPEPLKEHPLFPQVMSDLKVAAGIKVA